MNPTIQTQLSHRSIRRFQDKAIPPETLHLIMEAGRAASSSSFMQCVQVIRVTDKSVREKLFQAAGEQKYVKTAPEFWVFCIDYTKHHIASNKSQTDWVEALLIGAADAGIMAQNCLIAAESEGLGGVYIGALRDNIAAVDEALGLPENMMPMFGLCLGFPDQNPSLRPRLPLSYFFTENRPHTLDETALAEYDTLMADYYRARSNLDLNWSQAVENTLSHPVRPHMLAYLQRKGFAKR